MWLCYMSVWVILVDPIPVLNLVQYFCSKAAVLGLHGYMPVVMFEFSTDHIVLSNVPCGGPWDILGWYCTTVFHMRLTGLDGSLGPILWN